MTRFYEPYLTVDPNSPFVRDASNKPVRRSYWMDMDDRSLVMVMTKGIGANLTNDEKRAHLIDLKREHLIDRYVFKRSLRLRNSRTIPDNFAVLEGILFDRLQSCHLWQPCNKESKFHTVQPIKAKIHLNSPSSGNACRVYRRRLMGCLMKNGIATDGSLSHECFVLQINGRTDSIYMCYEDAMRAGLPLKHKFPHADIKVCEVDSIEEVAQGTVFH